MVFRALPKHYKNPERTLKTFLEFLGSSHQKIAFFRRALTPPKTWRYQKWISQNSTKGDPLGRQVVPLRDLTLSQTKRSPLVLFYDIDWRPRDPKI